MLSQDCWEQLLTELTAEREINLEGFLEDSDVCGSVNSVKASLYDLEEMGWVQVEEGTDGTIVTTGWKADMFRNQSD